MWRAVLVYQQIASQASGLFETLSTGPGVSVEEAIDLHLEKLLDLKALPTQSLSSMLEQLTYRKPNEPVRQIANMNHCRAMAIRPSELLAPIDKLVDSWGNLLGREKGKSPRFQVQEMLLQVITEIP